MTEEIQNEEVETSENNEAVETTEETKEETTEETKTEETQTEDTQKEETEDSKIEAQNKQLLARARKAEQEAKQAKARADAAESKNTKSLDIDDYIDISASLEGLDERTKAHLAEQHKLTGTPLAEIRQSEDFKLWQGGHAQRVEKEKTLAPDNTQIDESKPIPMADKLKELGKKPIGQSIKEMEEVLEKAGLYENPRPPSKRVNIGE